MVYQLVRLLIFHYCGTSNLQNALLFCFSKSKQAISGNIPLWSKGGKSVSAPTSVFSILIFWQVKFAL